jgi:hypothetical protein
MPTVSLPRARGIRAPASPPTRTGIPWCGRRDFVWNPNDTAILTEDGLTIWTENNLPLLVEG